MLYNGQNYDRVGFSKRDYMLSFTYSAGLNMGAMSWRAETSYADSSYVAFYDLTYDDYQWLSRAFNFPAWDTTSNDVQLVYKGEGSVTFTCYDPFSYSDEISYESGTIDGDLSTNFTITTNEGINANTIITLKNGVNGPTIGEIRVLQAIANDKNFTWNGKTGLISCDDGPVKFTGNSMVMINPDQTPVLSGISNATFTYRKRYY